MDLTIEQGTVFGLLGLNGAGKTTIVRMLATLLPPDSGTARVFGHDIVTEADALRNRVSLTGRENQVMLARLLEAADRHVKTYSGGMRRRIDIAASIVVRPDLIRLDGPTTGLDPRSRTQVWSIVRTLVEDGTTVLLTTQYLEEADQLADRIAVVDQGRARCTSGWWIRQQCLPGCTHSSM